MIYSENTQKITRKILFVIWIMTGLFSLSLNVYSAESRADQNLVALHRNNAGTENFTEAEFLLEKPTSECRIGVVQGYVLIVPVVLNQWADGNGINIIVNYDRNVIKAAGATLAGGIFEKKGCELLLDTAESDKLSITIPANPNISREESGKVVSLFFEAVGKGSSAISLTTFDCNKADADGGFSIGDGIYDTIRVFAQ